MWHLFSLSIVHCHRTFILLFNSIIYLEISTKLLLISNKKWGTEEDERSVLYSWTILLKKYCSKLNKQQWKICVFAWSVKHLIHPLGGMKPLPYHCLYFIANSFQYLVSSSTELKWCPSESSIMSPQSLKLLFHFPPWKIKGSSIRTKAVGSLTLLAAEQNTPPPTHWLLAWRPN